MMPEYTPQVARARDVILADIAEVITPNSRHSSLSMAVELVSLATGAKE
jgi:hypothetical protein